MTQAYETQRRGGELPATYEVIHAICWGAGRSTTDSKGHAGEALISPSSIRRRGVT
jgi:hypothetical protein